MDPTIKSNANSCVEEPAAPEWLSKLEHRREYLMRGKLGHELGAGAPCNDCGDKCPGLDLHFWRKVCRNCKCRKDQHTCTDEDLSGWAQFEILGQIRSKPAFIKIKALANQRVRLEWVPPNAAPDVVSEYMEKLGTTQIPVAGSNAAAKRKQQLEFQVPPHDLDAALCDNLTESEASQLQQYVQKIRENCVGQGNVVRVGRFGQGLKGHVAHIGTLDDSFAFNPEYIQVMEQLNEQPVLDPILSDILSCEKLQKAIVSRREPIASEYPKIFIAFSEPISETPIQDWHMANAADLISPPTKAKLCGLNKIAVQSLAQNGVIYDKMLAVLKEKNLDFSRDPKLGPIADFRQEYLQNAQFKNEIDELFIKNNNNLQIATPIKVVKSSTTPFNSPLPLKNPMQARFGAQMKQDTPMRKVKFGGVSTLVYDLGLPANVDYDKDNVFAQIINSEPLKQAFQLSKLGKPPGNVVIALSPMQPDFMDELTLSKKSKQALGSLGVDTKCIQSAVLNGPFYDRLFETLDDKGIDFAGCRLLTPMKQLREELLLNTPLNEEAREFVSQMPQSLSVAYGCPQNHPLRVSGSSSSGALRGSKSTDSGFDSKPSTPNYGTHPGLLMMGYEDVNAAAGRFSSIPGIEEMNMYPEVQPGGTSALPYVFQNMQISAPQETAKTVQQQQYQPSAAPTLSCRDCLESIGFGEIAVKAERAGKEIAWHPECFKCYTCRELLADLVYFFHGGQVYCGRDLAIKLKIPRCKACDELIFTKEYTAAEGATFHIKHFCCYQCDTPLAGQQYIPDERSNMPLCLKCYDEFFAAACQRCGQQIGPADQGVAWGEVHWHGSCFLCAGIDCGKSLIGGRFCVKENMPFCSSACVRSVVK